MPIRVDASSIAGAIGKVEAVASQSIRQIGSPLDFETDRHPLATVPATACLAHGDESP